MLCHLLLNLLFTRESHIQCCLSALNTKLLISLLPPSPVKRSRENHEACGSGTLPQKRQKEERKTEQDGSSPSALQRLKTTQTDYLSDLQLWCLTVKTMPVHPPKAAISNSMHCSHQLLWLLGSEMQALLSCCLPTFSLPWFACVHLFQPVRTICDGQTYSSGEADDELPGQR